MLAQIKNIDGFNVLEQELFLQNIEVKELLNFDIVEIIREKVIFSNCVFSKEVFFHAMTIFNSMVIDNCEFLDVFGFGAAQVKGEISITNSIFHKPVKIWDSSFDKKVSLHKNAFIKGMNLFDDTTIGSVEFKSGLEIFN